jgi:uncharacterized protein (UPF0332 family)
MSELTDTFLAKAEECLAGAESEFANGRYNNSANRCYYACFQAAIAALADAGITPLQHEWGHAFVQRQFVGLLINQRKLYPSALRDVLAHTLIARERADYKLTHVSQLQAQRSLRRARLLVEAVATRRMHAR